MGAAAAKWPDIRSFSVGNETAFSSPCDRKQTDFVKTESRLSAYVGRLNTTLILGRVSDDT